MEGRLVRLAAAGLMAIACGAASGRPSEAQPGPAPIVETASPASAGEAPRPRFQGSIHIVNPGESIQRILDIAQPGDVIQLADGQHKGNISTRRNGTADAPITITGSRNAILTGVGRSHVVQIEHDHTVVDGITIDGQEAGNDKLVYVQGTQPQRGPQGVKITNIHATNAGGECIRLQNYVSDTEIANNTIENCGLQNFDRAKQTGNGEGIYGGTATTQQNRVPGGGPDRTSNIYIHGNTINTGAAEGINTKEGTTGIVIENNDCTGQQDTNSACINVQGSESVIRGNSSYGNIGAGIRAGAANQADTQIYGILNEITDNIVFDNQGGGLNLRGQQKVVCGNTLSNNGQRGNVFGPFAPQYRPTATQPCAA